jgi:hypothetical protein
MIKFFADIFKYDFSSGNAKAIRVWSIFAIVFLFVFGVYDLLYDTGGGLYHHLTQFDGSTKKSV